MSFSLPDQFHGHAIDLRGLTREALEPDVGFWLLKARCCVCGTDFVGMRGVGTADGTTWVHCACLIAIQWHAQEATKTRRLPARAPRE